MRSDPPQRSCPQRGATAGVEVFVLREMDIAARLHDCHILLSPDERARAASFLRPSDGARFARFRATLRCLLGDRLGIPAQTVAFVETASGKPELAAGAGGGLAFNLSHSGDLLAVALGRGPLGIDIEHIRDGVDFAQLARRCLGPEERAEVARMRPAAARLAVWRAWTRKEAYLKATGEGLRRPLSSVRVTLAEQEPPRLVAVTGRPADPAIWRLHEIRPAPEVIGAVAVAEEGAVPRLRHDWLPARGRGG